MVIFLGTPGQPSSELQHVLGQNTIRPCRALELGCGTGTNSVCLAQQGFEATGIDVAPIAVKRAEDRAKAVQVKVRSVAADVLNLPATVMSDSPMMFSGWRLG
jgi:tRNA/tmRNA/rRNA uracil-C5-methylase (TrmA/RlmC/RlmD family)